MMGQSWAHLEVFVSEYWIRLDNFGIGTGGLRESRIGSRLTDSGRRVFKASWIEAD